MNNSRYKLFFAVPVLLFILYFGFIFDKLYSVIDGKIYRSAQLSAQTLQNVIENKNIKAIINLRKARPDEKWYQLESQTALKNNVKLYDIALPDHDLPKYRILNSLTDTLLTAEKPFLIHCRRGADRAGLASALALAIEQNLPLFEIKKQFSWRYGVIPYSGSIGDRVFSKYEQWLNRANRKHSRSNLLYWIKEAYVDYDGNVEYWIEMVNEKKFDPQKADIKRTSNPLWIRGWAFDAKNKSLLKDLRIIIDDQISAKATYKDYRPDVEKYLGFNKKTYQKFLLGWAVNFNSKDLTAGCHQMSVKFSKADLTSKIIPTKFELCID